MDEMEDPFYIPDGYVERPHGPGPFIVAGFDGVCKYGDAIKEDDIIRATGDGAWWEHQECSALADAGPIL